MREKKPVLNRAFTLVEMLIVVLIMVSSVLQSYQGSLAIWQGRETSKDKQTSEM